MRNILPAMVALLVVCATLAAGADAPLPPIVFVSRAHLSTLNNYDVGPPIEVSWRELTVGGTLNLLRSGGEVVTLAGPHNGIFDVQRPMVSFDGTRVVFSGVKARNGMWRIFEIGLDGRGLRQLTPEARGFDIPEDPRLPKANQSTFGRFGDFSPAYLPDGRIVFSSSRYPSISGSCGQRGLTLFIMNGDGGNMRRIVSTRSGAINPSVMADGRVLYAMWADNMNIPSLYTEGLQPLESDANFGPSFFEPWAVNPDGGGTGRVGFLAGRLTHGVGGGIHYREMPNGEIVYTRRASGGFLGSSLATAIAKFRPGDGEGNAPAGIGDPLVLDAPHALAPEPLPDGRILFSYTPKARTWTDEKHRLFGEFDYGLYVCDGDFQNIRLVYDNPGTHELDAVAVYARKPRIVPDEITSAPPDHPSPPIQGVAIFENRSVYADLDRRFTAMVGPPVGSVTAIDVYDDAQTFTTSNEFPLIRKQMPRLWKSFPVMDDGSFRAEIPADRPVFYVLRGPTGVAARYPDAMGSIRIPMFGHEQLRPGEVLRCSGCHRGHMIRPDISAQARINLARLAYTAGSSAKDSSYMGPSRAADANIGEASGRYQWVPAASDVWPWVRLIWEQRITAREIVIYPRPGVETPLGEMELYLSDGRRFSVRSDSRQPSEPIAVAVPDPKPIAWMHLQLIGFPNGGAPGVAEITVHGDALKPESPAPPPPPPSITVAPGTLRLSWTRSPSKSVIGYKIFAGPSPDDLPLEWDVSNVTYYQPEYLVPNQKYYFQIRAYDAVRFGPPQTQEVSGTVAPPRIDRITPDSGPTWGDAEVTIEGANFVSGVVVKIGSEYVRNLKFVSPAKLTGTTYRYSAGTWDVLVRNPGKQQSVLYKGFRYE